MAEVILIVEDDDGLGTAMKGLLGRAFPDKEIIHKVNFSQAAMVLTEGDVQISAIVLDNTFPMRDQEGPREDMGVEFLTRLRHGRFRKENSDLPVLVFSGDDELQEKIDLIDPNVKLLHKSWIGSLAENVQQTIDDARNKAGLVR